MVGVEGVVVVRAWWRLLRQDSKGGVFEEDVGWWYVIFEIEGCVSRLVRSKVWQKGCCCDGVVGFAVGFAADVVVGVRSTAGGECQSVSRTCS